MGLPDTAYAGHRLSKDGRYDEEFEPSQLAEALAPYDRSDPGAARTVIVASSDFA